MKRKKQDSSPAWLNQAEGKPAIDLLQTSKNFIIRAPIAGVEEKDLEITVENDLLNIQGSRPKPEADKKSRYLYQECYWGKFSRQVALPDNVNAGRIKASLEKGILTVTIPRLSKESGKKIEIG